MHYLVVFTLLIATVAAGSSGSSSDEAPLFSESMVTSQRHGDNFAYTITDHQGFMSGAKPVAISRALAPGHLSAYPAGAYVAPGVAPIGGVAGTSHYYGAVHNPAVTHHGVSAYAAQPATYPGQQPYVFGHHAVAPVVGVGVPQHHVVRQVRQF